MTSAQNTKFERGEVIVLTAGEYSDRGIHGFLVALKDFDLKEQIKRFDPNQEDYDCNYYELAGWLVTQELAIPVNYREVHLGAYDTWDKDLKS